MFADAQFKCGGLAIKGSSAYANLILFYALSITLRFGVIASAQEQVKVEAPKASATAPNSKKELAEDQVPSSGTKSSHDQDSKDPSQAKLLADVHRLQALSRELQTEIVNSKPDTLSVAAIKKLDELQRLAAVVKAEIGKTQ